MGGMAWVWIREYRDSALCPFRPVWNSHVNWNSQPPGTYWMYYVCVSVSPGLGGLRFIGALDAG